MKNCKSYPIHWTRSDCTVDKRPYFTCLTIHEKCWNITFITVSDCVEIDVVIIFSEKHETEPRLESVDGDNEKDADNPPLLCRVCVVAQILVDLVARNEDGSPNASSSDS